MLIQAINKPMKLDNIVSVQFTTPVSQSTARATSNDPYHSGHIVWVISFGPYDMAHIIYFLKKQGSLCERARSCDDDRACLNGGTCFGKSACDVAGLPCNNEICTMMDPPNYHCECEIGFSGYWCEQTNPCHPTKVIICLSQHFA